MSLVHITAQLQADPRSTATAQVDLVRTAVAFVSFVAITQVPSGVPAPIDSLSGALEVSVSVGATPASCETVIGSRLEVISGTAVMPVDSLVFTPALTELRTYALGWNTAGFANGSYWLRAVARKLDGTLAITTPFPVQLRNP